MRVTVRSLSQILANTLDKYGVSITQAASGTISQKPNIPGLTAPHAAGSAEAADG